MEKEVPFHDRSQATDNEFNLAEWRMENYPEEFEGISIDHVLFATVDLDEVGRFYLFRTPATPEHVGKVYFNALEGTDGAAENGSSRVGERLFYAKRLVDEDMTFFYTYVKHKGSEGIIEIYYGEDHKFHERVGRRAGPVYDFEGLRKRLLDCIGSGSSLKQLECVSSVLTEVERIIDELELEFESVFGDGEKLHAYREMKSAFSFFLTIQNDFIMLMGSGSSLARLDALIKKTSECIDWAQDLQGYIDNGLR